VRNLVIYSTNKSSQMYGFYFSAGTFTAENNMACVGGGTASASLVFGIYDNGQDAGRNFYHNSVYLDGTQNSGNAFTAAFFSGGSGNARTFRNNIFVNARNKGGNSNGSHYAVAGVLPDASCAVRKFRSRGGGAGDYGSDQEGLK
jgi:hypothetical protein